MKITKTQLRQNIKEAINEKLQGADMAHDYKKWAVHDHGADDWRDEAALDAYAAHMNLSPCSLHDLKATLGMLGEAKIVEEGKCPEDGCVQKREKGWVVISNKTGECWGRSKKKGGECTYYDSRADAEGALDAYHAGR